METSINNFSDTSKYWGEMRFTWRVKDLPKWKGEWGLKKRRTGNIKIKECVKLPNWGEDCFEKNNSSEWNGQRICVEIELSCWTITQKLFKIHGLHWMLKVNCTLVKLQFRKVILNKNSTLEWNTRKIYIITSLKRSHCWMRAGKLDALAQCLYARHCSLSPARLSGREIWPPYLLFVAHDYGFF